MDFHPNMIPVSCENEEQLQVLVTQMKLASLKSIDRIDSYKASSTEEEAYRKANSPASVKVSNESSENEFKIKVKTPLEEMLDIGILRFIFWKDCDKPINIVFTLREDEDLKQEWNLSISHGTTRGPQRVDDEIALVVANAFLDEGWQEVEPKAFWNTVRHFIKGKV